jgi:hypothetical protein
MILRSSSLAVTLGNGTRSPLIMPNTMEARVLTLTSAAISRGLRQRGG